MKFGTHIPLFGQDKWIMKNIENAYPHVDKIFIAYSNLPWNYNSEARNIYNNSFDIKNIVESKFRDKIEIIYGDWLKEEDQRNACVDKAKEFGINYLMIHDADEFYFNHEFVNMLNFIKNHPNYDIYTVPWICFWKSFTYALVDDNNNMIVGYPQVWINLDRNVRFVNKRKPSGSNIINIIGTICYHASYVLTDEELLEKLKTWGHHNDFNVNEWYENVWKGWEFNSINLHPINPSAWKRVVIFNKTLPEILIKNQ